MHTTPPDTSLKRKHTHPIISAAAVLIYLPSPSGFSGTGEIGKWTCGSSCGPGVGPAADESALGTLPVVAIVRVVMVVPAFPFAMA